MDGYVVLTLKVDAKVPEKADLSLLVKNSKVILLLDDLSNLKNRESDLLNFQQRLSECEVPWVVASTCQDEPELEHAQKKFERLYYDHRILKLWLLEPTRQQKKQLAESIWEKPWNPGSSDDYPTLGSIAMREAMAEMKRRFDILSDNDLEWADLLRALKLLDYAGVPCTQKRLRAILRDDKLFQHSDSHLLGSLDTLKDRGFLRPESTDPVQPERAYLRKVVKYVPGRKLEDDFDRLADILEELEDSEGLFYLGTTCIERLEARERAITYFDRTLRLRPHLLEALIWKGYALYYLGRYEEALDVYDEALRISPRFPTALLRKGNSLLALRRQEEALDVYDEALRISPGFPEALSNKGNALYYLGRREKALELFDEVLRIRPNDLTVLNNKAIVLNNLGRYKEARDAHKEAQKIFQSQAER